MEEYNDGMMETRKDCKNVIIRQLKNGMMKKWKVRGFKLKQANALRLSPYDWQLATGDWQLPTSYSLDAFRYAK